MEKLTGDRLYLNSILLGVMMNFTPFCGEERAKETHTFLRKVFDKLERYEDADLNNNILEDN
jgi:NADH:ubiquinone oxidoreductase subunit D